VNIRNHPRNSVRFTTEVAILNCLVGERHYDGMVGAVTHKELPPQGEIDVGRFLTLEI